jgi:O-antigen ligase
MKVAIVPTLVGAAVIASPLGSQIIDLLPYVGSAAQDTVDQRQQLAETSWRLIQQNPWFGNPFVLVQMEELRSGGGGIIDLVNGYVQVALFYGLFGLALFLAVYFLALHQSYFALRRSLVAGDHDMVWLGAGLIACMVASLFLMATSGQLWLQWVSAAMLGAYAKLQIVRAAEPARATSDSRFVRPRGATAI